MKNCKKNCSKIHMYEKIIFATLMAHCILFAPLCACGSLPHIIHECMHMDDLGELGSI
jgi:hypothetical protein